MDRGDKTTLQAINIGRMRFKRDGKYQALCPEETDFTKSLLDITSQDIEDLGLLIYISEMSLIILLHTTLLKKTGKEFTIFYNKYYNNQGPMSYYIKPNHKYSLGLDPDEMTELEKRSRTRSDSWKELDKLAELCRDEEKCGQTSQHHLAEKLFQVNNQMTGPSMIFAQYFLPEEIFFRFGTVIL